MARDPEVRRLLIAQRKLVDESTVLVTQLEEHVGMLMEFVDTPDSDALPPTSKTDKT